MRHERGGILIRQLRRRCLAQQFIYLFRLNLPDHQLLVVVQPVYVFRAEVNIQFGEVLSSGVYVHKPSVLHGKFLVKSRQLLVVRCNLLSSVY